MTYMPLIDVEQKSVQQISLQKVKTFVRTHKLRSKFIASDYLTTTKIIDIILPKKYYQQNLIITIIIPFDISPHLTQYFLSVTNILNKRSMSNTKMFVSLDDLLLEINSIIRLLLKNY